MKPKYADAWTKTQLGNHVDLLTGFPFKSANYTDDLQAVRLLRGDNVVQGHLRWDGVKHWAVSDSEDFSAYSLNLGDVILAMDRPWIEAGLKYAWITKQDLPCLLVQRVSRLRGVNGLITTYLRYVIADPGFTNYIRPIVTGVAVPHISPTQIKSYVFRLPPIDTQRKIAAILSAYDDLIENNTRRIKILEEMAQTLYREWFVKFHFPGHEKARMVKTRSGQVPEGWETVKLEDVATFHRGKSYRTPDLAEEGGLPFLNLKCIERGGGFRHNGIKRYIGVYKLEHIAKTGDLIVAVTDMTQERRLVAHAARVHLLDESMAVMSMDLVRVEPKRDIPKDYLHGMLRFSSFGDEVSQHANGVNVLHLNPAQIEAFQFVLPPSKLRNQFAEFCRDSYLQIDALHAKNVNLRRTRDLLLPKLISGEVDMEELEIKLGDYRT